VAAVVVLTGCGGGRDHSEPAPHASSPSPAAPRAGAPASARAEHALADTVTRAPVLTEGEVVAEAANVSGNREMEIRGGLADGLLSVLVNCQGKGTLTVSVERVGLTFPLRCEDGKVNSTLNRLALKRPHAPATVTVTAPSHVRWALTVALRRE
jgi:hypothetical protein